MQVVYSCGCTVRRDDVGIPASWPMPYYCPAHGAPRPIVAELRQPRPGSTKAA